MTSLSDVDAAKARYRCFVERECKGYSDLYYSLAIATASDDELIEFISEMPETQPNLFFAVIQFLTGPEAMPRSGQELREFVSGRRTEVAELMRTHRTQTNEVGRCAVVLPALPVGNPLALLEVGASAGLCLLIDRYFYDYGSVTVGDESSPVHLRCSVAAPAPVPERVPDIVWRAGLDLNPVDATDDEAVRWLLSCVWADHADRRERLASAFDMSRDWNPRVYRGDLADDLPALIGEVPRDATLVVFHSAVLPYVAAERRARFAAELSQASQHRAVTWISNEGPGVLSEIDSLAPPMKAMSFLLARTEFAEGVREDRFLGFAHPHGATLEWLAGDPRVSARP